MRKYIKLTVVTVVVVTLMMVIVKAIDASDSYVCPTSMFGMTVGETVAADVKPAEVHDKYLSFAFEPDAAFVPKLGFTDYRANATLESRTIYAITAGCKIPFEEEAKITVSKLMEWSGEKHGGEFVKYECKNRNISMWKCPFYSSGILGSKREVGVIAVSMIRDAEYNRYVVTISLFITKYCDLQSEEAKSYVPSARIISGKPPERSNSGKNFSLTQYLYDNAEKRSL